MRDHHYFEKYIAHHQMRAQGYVDTKLGRVLLADSETAINDGDRMVYRTAYCIHRNGLDFASMNDYEFNETGGSYSDQKVRLQEAIDNAYQRMALLEAAGYYDDDRKHDFAAH